MGATLTDLLVVHWFTSIFDLTIAIWMIYGLTRPWASVFCAAFHLMNSNLFSIGMFPFLCLTQMPLFFERDWPRKWILFYRRQINKSLHDMAIPINKTDSTIKVCIRKRVCTILVLFYCSMQAGLPYSHFITRGYNTWTDGPYGYSWDMMIHAWDTIRVSVTVRDNQNGQLHYIDPKAFAFSDRWSKHADMAHQFVQCLNQHLVEDFLANNAESPLTSTNVSIFLDVWCSLNGRFQQRIFDPNVDILNAPWTPWRSSSWVLPLISTISPDRSELQQISRSVVADQSSDVLFVADFPGLSVLHKVSNELDQVWLTVMHGEVGLSAECSQEVILRSGMKVQIDAGQQHEVRTMGRSPSGSMYVFLNRTLLNEPKELDKSQNVAFLLWKVFKKRCSNYDRFVRNCIYSVVLEINVVWRHYLRG